MMLKYIKVVNYRIVKGVAGEDIAIYKKDGVMKIIEKNGMSHMTFIVIAGKGHVLKLNHIYTSEPTWMWMEITKPINYLGLEITDTLNIRVYKDDSFLKNKIEEIVDNDFREDFLQRWVVDKEKK